jgi:hypothetical protein
MPLAARAPGTAEGSTWRLALDEIEDTGFVLRMALPGDPHLLEAAAPVQLQPLELDPLTVIDDHDWLDVLDKEPNLPPYLAPGLRALYP